MSTKTPILILLGMCLSFSLVMAAIIALRPHPAPPKRRPPALAQYRAPAAPAAPAPSPKTEPKPQTLAPSPALKPMDLTPSAEAARELDLVKKELRTQIAALKKDRGQMIGNLAAQLADLPLTEAAAQLAALDDESAALVLVHLKPEIRRALVDQLEPARGKRLTLALTPPSR